MSTQWWLHTDTRRDEDAILSFLRTLPGAALSSEFPEHRERCVEYGGHALASLYRPPRGSAESSRPIYGFTRTLCLVFNWVRGADRTGFRATVYRVAQGFTRWDETCDFWFAQDDRGICTRRGGAWLVNPFQFETAELRESLPAHFTTADPPETELEKAGWPPVACRPGGS